MSFEPLKRRLLDRNGQQVAESIQLAVVRAFEQALSLPDANIDRLISAARRAAKTIAEGGVVTPDAYAFAVLGRAAWQSQQQFNSDWQLKFMDAADTVVLSSADGNSSALIADVEIRKLLSVLDERDQTIMLMRGRGFLFKEIGEELGIPVVTVRYRYFVAKNRILKASSDKR